MLDFELPYAENRAGVARMIAQAKERGLRVLLIPHLWVETEGWRGDIDPGSAEEWAAYQASYREFVLAWARDAQAFGADAFSIGVECKSWSGRFGGFWTGLIAEVRQVFDGALTYSANWDEVEDVLFWDQLDWIGVNAFYPLADARMARVTRLRGVRQNGARRTRRVRGRAGHADRARGDRLHDARDAAVEPWLWPDGMRDVIVDEREQARALAAIAEAAARRRDVLGFFVWRYYANLDDVSQEAVWGFSPHAKQAGRRARADLLAKVGRGPQGNGIRSGAARAARALARAALVTQRAARALTSTRSPCRTRAPRPAAHSARHGARRSESRGHSSPCRDRTSRSLRT